MKKAIKILAVLMAMLMLVSMATACKSSDDDMDNILSSDTNISNNDDGGNGDGDVNIDDEGDDPSNPSDNKTEDDKDEGKNNNKNPDKNNNKNENKNDPSSDNVDEEKWKDIMEDYDETKKYDADANPLIAEAKPLNTGVGVCFDIDTTGFVKNKIKLTDLKGKTFILITAEDQPYFNYKDASGKTVTEWDWWELMREEYGLKIKYIKTDIRESVPKNLTYLSSGKQIDIVPTHRSYFPQWLNLSQALDPYVNTNLIGNSPGVDLRTLEQTKWDGTYRCIAPIGAVDVIWYNETLVNQLGLQDPHTLWKQDKWNWETWKNFIVSVPTQGPTGKGLAPWCQASYDTIACWPQTTGLTLFDIDRTSKEPKLINNFNDERVTKALTFYSNTLHSVDFFERLTLPDGKSSIELYSDGTLMMSNTEFLCSDFSNDDFAKTQKFNWVPYPKSMDASGVNVAMSYGCAMMLPRKMKVEKNAPYAVKFMELWANRTTEALFDFQKAGHLKFNYAQRKEYYEFVSQNNYFGIGYRVLEVLTGDEMEYYKQLTWSMYNKNWNTATSIEKLRNLAAKACEEVVKYGD